jgi:uncharacterized protein
MPLPTPNWHAFPYGGYNMKYRRFGKTELQMPVISCGGMRYQESWNSDDPVSDANQANLEACIRRSLELGINHIETARGYGTSEGQLGRILPTLPRDEMIVQTKVGPSADVAEFAATFEKSMSLLKLDHVDLFSFHGINTQEILENTMKCMDHALAWQKEGRIRHIGFSTHGPTDVIVKAIETGAFTHVNLHYFYVFQNNLPAVLAANKQDMGVFIISPNDKGGLLYDPPEKLKALTAPLHPMVFNGLFCLAHPEVHTLSCGVSKPEDFDIHLETAEKSEQAVEIVLPIEDRLNAELDRMLGTEWMRTWERGLPNPENAPGEVNIPWALRLRNLALAFDMVKFAKMRYNLLGGGGHWFPGNRLDKLNGADLTDCLKDSPHAEEIPDFLAETHELLKGEEKKRLQED